MQDEATNPRAGVGILSGLRVIELADEQAEFCGMALAGLGATVIKVEPPSGSPTRAIGPFVDDVPDPEASLHFWHYNRGKRSVVLDLSRPGDVASLGRLLDGADVLLESTPRGFLDAIGLGQEWLRRRWPALVIARMTAFGDQGPWADFVGSDLIHLALGGVTMNCGYDPDLEGHYDLPPVAPQMWHAFSIAGDQLCMGIMAALLYRDRTGEGQVVSCAIHEAVAKCTELDLMCWVMRAVPLRRQTCRHARETVTSPIIAHTKDGRWFMNFSEPKRTRAFIAGLGLPGLGATEPGAVAGDEPEAKPKPRAIPGSEAETAEVIESASLLQRLGLRLRYDEVPWPRAQAQGLMWAPLRLPHENASDEHWIARGSFAEIEHPERGLRVTYPVSRWRSTGPGWIVPHRAPLLGEHTQAERDAPPEPRSATAYARPRDPATEVPSARGRPFPLSDVRILDFTWFLASAGGTRFLSAFGADTIKVEWKEHPDTRLGAMAPIGGREARRRATGPLPPETDPAMGGQFHHKNAGKRGISLNVRHPKGLEIARQLVEVCDVVAEGFSPGVMDRWGLGYDELRRLRHDVIYVQQSGMGSFGTYGRLRAVGPIAASFVGLSEMSGLPLPSQPAGWGYSYLDWVGAYSFSLAILTGLYHRNRSGESQLIDASQCEAGLFVTGTAVADWSVNRRAYTRTGNRSPYKAAAPHGIYRCAGEDRWLAIACFDDDQWSALAKVIGLAEVESLRFAQLATRLSRQDELDGVVTRWTSGQDVYEAMAVLQSLGVPAGVCQTAADRCDRDPQLAALDWMVEVPGSRIGTWPVPEVPARLGASPAYVGGPTRRGAPMYGEDNHLILGTLLNYSEEEIEQLEADGVI